jgi:hypothetical protein
LGAYSIPSETGLLISSGCDSYRSRSRDDRRLQLQQLRVLRFGFFRMGMWGSASFQRAKK